MQRKQKKKLKKEKKTKNSYCFCTSCYSWVEELFPHSCYDYITSELEQKILSLTASNVRYQLPNIIKDIVNEVFLSYKSRIVKKDFI